MLFADLVPAVLLGAACERSRVVPAMIFVFCWVSGHGQGVCDSVLMLPRPHSATTPWLTGSGAPMDGLTSGVFLSEFKQLEASRMN